MLDAALLRQGRFDRRVSVDRPDRRGREQILKVRTSIIFGRTSASLSGTGSGIPIPNSVALRDDLLIVPHAARAWRSGPVKC